MKSSVRHSNPSDPSEDGRNDDFFILDFFEEKAKEESTQTKFKFKYPITTFLIRMVIISLVINLFVFLFKFII